MSAGGGADGAGADVRVAPLDDLAAMRRLGLACGLEDGGRDDEGVLAAWGAWAGDQLVGALCLERQSGLDTPNWLAVDEGFRRRGVAAALYAELEREARRRGMSRLWVTARAPGFFLAQGFEPVPPSAERGLLLGDCLACAQFGHGCDPQALTKSLQTTSPSGS
jgi:amino-acid N-acetyltransferase